MYSFKDIKIDLIRFLLYLMKSIANGFAFFISKPLTHNTGYNASSSQSQGVINAHAHRFLCQCHARTRGRVPSDEMAMFKTAI